MKRVQITGAGGAIGHCLRAHLHGPYAETRLAAFWGFVVWGEAPGALSMLGTVLILASGVFMALREAWGRP